MVLARMETRYFTPGLLVLALAFAVPVAAQTAPPQNGDGGTEAEAPRVASLPSVFMDCNGPNCNQNYYRTEIDWVNWVRDPGVSDVHVIVTSQMTGGGGREYLMDFSGGERFPDYTDRVVLRTQQGNTERESLDQMTHMLSLGLARFAASNGYPAIVRIEGNEVEAAICDLNYAQTTGLAGDHEAAIERYKQAREVFERVGRPQDVAACDKGIKDELRCATGLERE